jgi:surface protein
MSARYGQKVGPVSTKNIASSFVSSNRNNLPYTGSLASFRTTPVPYTRPSDYLPIPTIINSEQKVAALVFISNDNSNFLSFIFNGNYTVDWGDGVVENVSSGVQANHVYNYSTFDPTNLTLTSNGFKQAIVIITPQAGQNLTVINFSARHPSTASANAYAQPVEELYISGPNLTSISLQSGNVYCKRASYINLINSGNANQFGYLFSGLVGLKKADIGKTGAVVATNNMFFSCTSLQEVTFSSETNFSSNLNASAMFMNCQALVSVPLFNIGSATNMQQMFNNCYALRTVPLFNTGSAINMINMFINCYSLTAVPLFDTKNVTSMASMFQGCVSLISVPLLDTINVTSMASMFSTCYSLISVPLFNTIKVTTMANMFQDCRGLISVPLFNTINLINMTSMFSTCNSLTFIPLFDTRNVTSMQNTFFSCLSLKTVPLFNTIKVTSFSTMFQACASLITIPQFNTVALTNMNSMFQGCSNLKTIPLLETSLVANMSTMFQNCYSLESVPLLNTANVPSMASMFNNCFNLKTVPLFDTVKVTTMDSMFQGCGSLVSVPVFNTIAVTTMVGMFFNCFSLITPPAFNIPAANLTNMFNGCSLLANIPAFNVNAATNFTTIFSNTFSIASIAMTNIKYSVDFTNLKLSKEALETIFTNLGTADAAATRTLTLTNNWGAPTPVSLNGTTTEGSVTIPMASTTGLAVGMQVAGTNTPLTTGETVTFTDVGDLVNLNNHGLSNGDEVSFSVITTTTGIVINTIYFVVGATTNTFQVSASVGGTVLPLTTNGSGAVKYNSIIASINPNVSVTMSRPMTGNSGTPISLSFRLLQTYRAVLKGFAITG